MKHTNLQKEQQLALALAREASAAILPLYYSGVDVEDKEDGSPVTIADKRSNQIILDGIQKAFPNDGIVSEELDTISGKRFWYVDPIDGTKGFIGHSDQFAIHIALAEKGDTPMLGLVYKPTTGEYYITARGEGAYRVNPDGSKTQLQVAGDREGLRIVTNMTFTLKQRTLVDILQADKLYMGGGLGLRAMRVAEGLADIYIKDSDNGGTWDTAAPQAIIEEAGGIVMRLDGSPVIYSGQRGPSERMVFSKNRDLGLYVADIVQKYVK